MLRLMQCRNKSGDARVLNDLGEITPLNGHCMAMISTGVGSGQTSNLGGLKGSEVSQTFQIPEWATSLSFKYNAVTEAPMEYIGTPYDNKFYARIYDVHNVEILQAAYESFNTSKWYYSGDVYFDGNSFPYGTSWKKVSIDVSACRGSFITLRFDIYDLCGSAYDTIAVIDNVVFE